MTPLSQFSNLALLVSRVLLGVVLIAHGWQKFTEWGLDGTAETFAGLGVPLPAAAAVVAALVELVGGALLVVGWATRWVGILVAVQMLFAYLFAHVGKGVFVADGGFELVGLIAAGALALAAAGAGSWSLDGLTTRLMTRRRA